LAAFAAAWRSIPEDCGETRSASLDYKGTLASTLGIAGLILALTRRSAAAAAAGLIFLAAFVWIERRAPAPLLPLSSFRSRTFSLANLFTFVLYAAVGAAFFYLPLHMITIERWSSARAGLALLPMVLLMFTLSPLAGALLRRLGPARLLALGPLVSAAGFGTLAFLARPYGSYWTSYFPSLCLFGLGMGLTVAPLTDTAVAALGEARAGLASGVNNAAARIAGLFGVAGASWGGARLYRVALERETLDRVSAPLRLQARALALDFGPFGAHQAQRGRSAAEALARSCAAQAAFPTLRRLALAVAALCLIAACLGALLKTEPGQPAATNP